MIFPCEVWFPNLDVVGEVWNIKVWVGIFWHKSHNLYICNFHYILNTFLRNQIIRIYHILYKYYLFMNIMIGSFFALCISFFFFCCFEYKTDFYKLWYIKINWITETSKNSVWFSFVESWNNYEYLLNNFSMKQVWEINLKIHKINSCISP